MQQEQLLNICHVKAVKQNKKKKNQENRIILYYTEIKIIDSGILWGLPAVEWHSGNNFKLNMEFRGIYLHHLFSTFVFSSWG